MPRKHVLACTAALAPLTVSRAMVKIPPKIHLTPEPLQDRGEEQSCKALRRIKTAGLKRRTGKAHSEMDTGGENPEGRKIRSGLDLDAQLGCQYDGVGGASRLLVQRTTPIYRSG